MLWFLEVLILVITIPQTLLVLGIGLIGYLDKKILVDGEQMFPILMGWVAICVLHFLRFH